MVDSVLKKKWFTTNPEAPKNRLMRCKVGEDTKDTKEIKETKEIKKAQDGFRSCFGWHSFRKKSNRNE
jgi:hypothetical protein